MSAPAPRVAVGNDVVDLSRARCVGRSAARRFLERVFAPAERAAIAAAPRPDLDLWLRWAAKEAAFKAVSKARGEPPPFRHAAFQVVVDPPEGPGEAGAAARARGSVSWGEERVRWRARWRGEVGGAESCLHVVAWTAGAEAAAVRERRGQTRRLATGAGALLAAFDPASARFTERERRAVHGAPSALVRLRARAHAARVLGLEERRLEIVCGPGPAGRTPPLLLLDGAPTELDVSLSHDGSFVAWALSEGGEGEGAWPALPPAAPLQKGVSQ